MKRRTVPCKKLAIWSIYLMNWVFLPQGFDDLMAPSSVRLEASKKVLLVPQIIDPYRINLNEQKIVPAHFDPQGVLIPKI